MKFVKKLICSTIGKSVLNYHDFEFVMCQTVHMVNRRPIAYMESLRENSLLEMPSPLTPEILLRGYELVSLNVIPQYDCSGDPDWLLGDYNKHLGNSHKQLSKARACLVKLYNEEFLAKLQKQASDTSERYKPVSHRGLEM